MRPSDIVNQLRVLLPIYTELFSDQLAVYSIVVDSGIATVTTTTEHNLIDGDAVTIANVSQRTPIDLVTKNGNIATLRTSVPHDLTEGHQESITFSGFTDDEWNSSFALSTVPSRKYFTIKNTLLAPTLNGNEVLHENRIDGVNGQYSVMVTSPTTFTIVTDANEGTYVDGTVSGSVRVAVGATVERCQAQYEEMSANQFWGFIVPQDVNVSKDRSTYSDAVASMPTGTDIRLRMLDQFTFYVFVPTDEQVAAEDALDICRHDLLLPITRSLFGAKFSSGLSAKTDFRVIITGHGLFGYNEAYYIHEYNFEAVYDLTDGDTVPNMATRAFRDINYIQRHGSDDTVDLLANINLDDEPI